MHVRRLTIAVLLWGMFVPWGWGRILPPARWLVSPGAARPFGVFHYNPAVVDTASEGQVSLFSLTGSKAGLFTLKDSAGNVVEDNDNQDTYTAQGVGWSASLGSGLYFAVTYMSWKSEQINRSFRRRADFPETFERAWGGLKAAFDLAENIFGGFRIDYVSYEDNLVGSLNLSPQSITRVAGDGIVNTVGVDARFDAFGIGASYQLPLRAKSEVYSEEKFVSSAGMRSLALSYQLDAWRFLLAQADFEYKDGDRAEGTTANNENETFISLFGLNRYYQSMFPLVWRELDLHYVADTNLYGGVGIGNWEVEFLNDSRDTLPGTRADPSTYTAREAHVWLQYLFSELKFSVGARRVWDAMADTAVGRRVAAYEAVSKSVYLGVRTDF